MKKKTVLILVILAVVLLAAGLFYHSQRQKKNFSAEARDKQQEVMKEYWREQGLTNKEIEERMQRGRPSGSPNASAESEGRTPPEGMQPPTDTDGEEVALPAAELN